MQAIYHKAVSSRIRVFPSRRNGIDDEARIRRRFAESKLACAQPTDASPGSEDKTRVMAERVAAGLPIFHPDDRQEHSNAPFLSNLMVGADRDEDEFGDEDEFEEDDEIDIGGEG